MSVELIDSRIINNFIEDEEAFTAALQCRYAELDSDHDGVLCYAEILKEFQSLRILDTDFGSDFDHDKDGVVSLKEYMAETKEMMMAIANEIGFMPIQMVLEKDSLLMKAVEREHS
ncbi:uncharacterized protein LOC133780124 [Humulus lupulus]|uniref:uncharacterized protein LOC133780124 n=1 Tax=Humulus lupulus TaxID=3486 RepID=UPI002B40AB0D|nr:uncharacterized protein LOC133780124 [Humulus lupulus]